MAERILRMAAGTGDQAALLALPLVALLALHVGVLDVALLRALAAAPYALLPLAPRLPSGRRVLIAADAGRAAALASVPVAHWLGGLTVAQLLAVAAVYGLLGALFEPPAVPLLATLAGPLLGGGLVAALGAPAALLAGVVRGGGEPARRPTLWRSRPWGAVAACCASAALTVLVVHLVDDLHAGAFAVGWVTAVLNAGAVAGALANAALVRRLGPGPLLAYGGVASGLLLLGLASSSLALLAVCGGLAAGCATVASANRPEPSVVVWGAVALGAALGGVLGATIGVRPTLLAAAAGAALASLPLLSDRRLRGEQPLSVEPLDRVRSTVSGDARAAGDGGVAAPAR